MRGKQSRPSVRAGHGGSTVDDSHSARRAADTPTPPAGGDEALRWAMLLSHREHAITVVRRKLGDPAEAEDCVHDATLRLVRRSDLDPERLHSLLVRTALHLALDRRRAARRAERALVRLGGGAAAEVVSPDCLLADEMGAARIMAAVDSLPRRQRQVFLLRLAGLRVGEIARLLGLSDKAIEGAYARARARIRLAIGPALAWTSLRLRRITSSRGEVGVATLAALLLVGPFGTAARGATAGGGDDGDGGHRATLLATGGAGRAAQQRADWSRDHGGSITSGGGAAGSMRGAPSGPGRTPYALVIVPINVPGPSKHDPPLVNTTIAITWGPQHTLGPVGGIQRCLAQAGPRISLTQDFCGN